MKNHSPPQKTTKTRGYSRPRFFFFLFFLHNNTLLNLNKEQGAHIIDFLIYSFLLCPHPFLASSQRRTNARKRVRRSTSLLFLYGGCKSAHLHEGGGGGHKHHILTMPVNEMQQVAEVLCELRKFIKYNSEGAAQKKKTQKKQWQHLSPP